MRMRIISLVPSLTEYLWALGLDREIVGITKFCIHPHAWWQQKTRVGGTKSVNMATIHSLEPTLIIANKEENTQTDIQALALTYDVLLTDINSVEEALAALLLIGEKVGKIEKSQEHVIQIQNSFKEAQAVGKGAHFLYFIWKDPYFVVGTNTYIHSLLSKFGFVNSCPLERYPNLDDLLNENCEMQLAPDYLFLSTEPYPFEEKHFAHLQELFPQSKIRLIDGEVCSWYGNKMVDAKFYFEKFCQNQL